MTLITPQGEKDHGGEQQGSSLPLSRSMTFTLTTGKKPLKYKTMNYGTYNTNGPAEEGGFNLDLFNDASELFASFEEGDEEETNIPSISFEEFKRMRDGESLFD